MLPIASSFSCFTLKLFNLNISEVELLLKVIKRKIYWEDFIFLSNVKILVPFNFNLSHLEVHFYLFLCSDFYFSWVRKISLLSKAQVELRIVNK